MRVSILLAAVFLCASAWAQFQWIDASGQHVFSDQPPPANIPDENIIKSSDQYLKTQNTSPTATARQAAESAAGAAKNEAQKQQAEQEAREAQEKEQQEQQEQQKQLQALREDNCRRAQAARRNLESGRRLAQVNEKGERSIMSDAQRAAELRRADEIIADNCQ